MKYWLIALLVIADQGTKYLALRYLAHRVETIWLIPGWLGLRYSPNTGAAFSMLAGHTFYLSLFSIAAVILIAWIAIQTPAWQRWNLWGYNLILGGALGNLVDRAVRGEEWLQGHVVDFMKFPWFINNLADDFICLGVAFWIVGFFLYPPPKEGEKKKVESGAEKGIAEDGREQGGTAE